jgi:uncharacterized membrane protein
VTTVTTVTTVTNTTAVEPGGRRDRPPEDLTKLGVLAAVVRRSARRALQHHPIPPILVIGVIGITTRTLVAVISHSSFVYFFQPILGSVAMGCVFLISIAVGRPLIGKLAGEFWPMTPEVAARPGVLLLFRRLTFLWAGINLTTAAVTMCLLVSMPLGLFLAAKQVSGLAITLGAVFITISLSLNTARREGLVAPRRPTSPRSALSPAA